MREIKFRGKSALNSKWYYGDFITDIGEYNRTCDKAYILPHWDKLNIPIQVTPESVGEFTGLLDKNGVSIYEGDILRNPPKSEWEKKNFVAFEVFFHDNDCADNHIGWQFNRLHFQGSTCGYNMMEKFLPKYTERMEIIGNIYENPELIEGVNT